MPAYVPNPTPGAGIPPDLFEQLGAAMAARYAEAETTMIERLKALAVLEMETPQGALERLAILKQLRLEGEAIAIALRDPALVNQLIAIAAADGEAAAIARLGIADRIARTSQITGTAANAVGSIAIDLSNSLDDMSERITRWMPDAYRQVISMVAPNVILGVDTLAQAQRNATEQFLARGVRGFTDAAGREWRIGTYAEMATRTTVNRAWMDANIFQQQQSGINLVSIVIGVNACKACAAHSGKIYSTDGTPAGTYELAHSTEDRTVTVTVAGTLAEARAQGWNHPNCRCVVVAYLPGLSIVRGSTYDPQAEADRDRLRALERRVRDLKRSEAASFDDVKAARYRRLIKRAQADIRSHTAETGLLRRNYREQLSFSDGKPLLPPAPRPRVVTPPSAPRALPSPRPTQSFRALTTPPPSTAPTELARSIDKARIANGRALLNAATTPAEVGNALRVALNGTGIAVEGFTGRLAMESIRQFALGALTLIERYPNTVLNKIEIGGAARGSMASARALYSNGKLDRAEIQASRTYFSDRDKLVGAHSHADSVGHFHHTDDVDAALYTITHEFGHVMDYTTNLRIRREVYGIRNRYAVEIGLDPSSRKISDDKKIRDLTSNYGNRNNAEMVAESFADVELNGDNASELAKRIHARLLEILAEEGGL